MTKTESSRANIDEQKPVESLNAHDVLLGRGNGSNEYVGNRAFRAKVQARKKEYASANNENKGRIAKAVFDSIKSRGGRFLRMKKSTEPVSNIVEEGTWYAVDEKQAVEKVKQALREKKTLPPPETSIPATLTACENDDVGLPVGPVPISQPFSTLSESLAPVLPATLIGSVTQPTAMDFRFLSYSFMTQQPFAQLDPTYVSQNGLSAAYFPGVTVSMPTVSRRQSNNSQQMPVASVRSQAPPVSPDFNEGIRTDKQYNREDISNGKQAHNEEMTNSNASIPLERNSLPPPNATDDEEVSEYILSMLSLSGRRKITEEQFSLEQASVTDEEKAKLLCDLFGKYCSIHQNKRAKRDLSADEVAFLVAQMRLEIDMIPDADKSALLEALQKCRSDEFSDERLERFLRCEGMDVKLGARRFVSYWQCRREVFGRDKFTMRMTFGEALKDDLVALQTCTYCLLPQRDRSGRQILYLDPARHTRDGYDSESLVSNVYPEHSFYRLLSRIPWLSHMDILLTPT